MKKLAALFCLAIMSIVQAPAQDVDVDNIRADFAVGYSHFNSDIGQHGVRLGAAYRPTRWLGLFADTSFHRGSEDVFTIDTSANSQHLYVGPRVYVPLREMPRLQPFGHLLFGVSRISIESQAAGIDSSDTGFTWGLGGGADWMLTNTWGARFQADWLRAKWFNSTDDNLRTTIGVVYRWGR